MTSFSRKTFFSTIVVFSIIQQGHSVSSPTCHALWLSHPGELAHGVYCSTWYNAHQVDEHNPGSYEPCYHRCKTDPECVAFYYDGNPFSTARSAVAAGKVTAELAKTNFLGYGHCGLCKQGLTVRYLRHVV